MVSTIGLQTSVLLKEQLKHEVLWGAFIYNRQNTKTFLKYPLNLCRNFSYYCFDKGRQLEFLSSCLKTNFPLDRKPVWLRRSDQTKPARFLPNSSLFLLQQKTLFEFVNPKLDVDEGSVQVNSQGQCDPGCACCGGVGGVGRRTEWQLSPRETLLTLYNCFII